VRASVARVGRQKDINVLIGDPSERVQSTLRAVLHNKLLYRKLNS